MTICSSSDCGATLGARNKTGRCRSCSARILNTDPTMIALREAGQAAFFAKPETKAALRERINRYHANAPAAEIERRRIHGQAMARNVLSRPEVRAHAASPEVRRKAGIARTNTVLAWCPPEYRERYREIQYMKHGNAAEARAIIEAEIAAIERRRIAALTPFERQMARVRAGATISERVPMPSRVHGITLGGVSDMGA